MTGDPIGYVIADREGTLLHDATAAAVIVWGDQDPADTSARALDGANPGHGPHQVCALTPVRHVGCLLCNGAGDLELHPDPRYIDDTVAVHRGCYDQWTRDLAEHAAERQAVAS